MSKTEHDKKAPTVKTVPTSSDNVHDDAASDVMSDPARADDIGTDWTDEGGAAPEGPATNSDQS